MSDLSVKNLSFSYDSKAVLQNISFEYKKENFLSLFGPNGGGKSTLLKLILSLLKPDCGEIKIFGANPEKAKNKIGYVPQFIDINKNFPINVLDVVLMGRIDKKIFGFYSKEDKNFALKCLEKVGMSEFYSRKICDLSGGQRQRVYIARALCANAEILLLDEPLASIDTMGQVKIYELLKNLNQNGVGIVMISHDINLALNYADKAAYIANGTLVMHDIDTKNGAKFLEHLERSHSHFCAVELAMRKCGCHE